MVRYLRIYLLSDLTLYITLVAVQLPAALVQIVLSGYKFNICLKVSVYIYSFIQVNMFRPWEKNCSLQTVEDDIFFDMKYVHLSEDARKIISNVYNFLKKQEDCDAALEHTAIMTRVTKCTVQKISENPIPIASERKSRNLLLDERDYDVIRRKIYEMFNLKTVATLSTLHEKLKKDNTGIICSRSTLHRTLQKIGFRFSTIDKRQILMESRRIQEWRWNYLRAIHTFREQQRTICYLDETWFHTFDTVKKGWQDGSENCKLNVPPNRGKRVIILHAGTENGFVDDCLRLSAKNIKDSCLDYHEDMTADLFEDWFQTKLIPNLPNNSVIVMDNASYHSRLVKRVPNSSNSKGEISEFLYDNDIYFENSYKKKELLEVLKIKSFPKKYVIDEMAKKYGHDVLRLPPYYCVFNPIEMVWSELKNNIRKHNVAPTENDKVLEVIKQEVLKFNPIHWQKCIKHVIDIENSYNVVTTQPLIINLDDISSTDSSDDTE